ALPDLSGQRRPRSVHGVRAGVLEELLSVRGPTRPVREGAGMEGPAHGGRSARCEERPGSKYAHHARGNRGLQSELREIFRTRSCAEWIRLGDEQNFPIAPVNTPKTIVDDPQFRDRFPWYSQEKHG